MIRNGESLGLLKYKTEVIPTLGAASSPRPQLGEAKIAIEAVKADLDRQTVFHDLFDFHMPKIRKKVINKPTKKGKLLALLFASKSYEK